MTKKVALALGSGGARGYAHIGVIEALLENNFTITQISGCSMGAVVGAFYAAGSMHKFKDWVMSLNSLDVLKLFDFRLSSESFCSNKIFDTIDLMLMNINIEDLNIPYCSVASSLYTNKEVVARSGSLSVALHASSAIPGIFSPVLSSGHYLVDGGLINPVPVNRLNLQEELVIAVNLNGLMELEQLGIYNNTSDKQKSENNIKYLLYKYYHKIPNMLNINNKHHSLNKLRADLLMHAEKNDNSTKTKTPNIIESITQSWELMQHNIMIANFKNQSPDILIDIPFHIGRFFEFHKAAAFIEIGKSITLNKLRQYRLI